MFSANTRKSIEIPKRHSKQFYQSRGSLGIPAGVGFARSNGGSSDQKGGEGRRRHCHVRQGGRGISYAGSSFSTVAERDGLGPPAAPTARSQLFWCTFSVIYVACLGRRILLCRSSSTERCAAGPQPDCERLKAERGAVFIPGIARVRHHLSAKTPYSSWNLSRGPRVQLPLSPAGVRALNHPSPRRH